LSSKASLATLQIVALMAMGIGRFLFDQSCCLATCANGSEAEVTVDPPACRAVVVDSTGLSEVNGEGSSFALEKTNALPEAKVLAGLPVNIRKIEADIMDLSYSTEVPEESVSPFSQISDCSNGDAGQNRKGSQRQLTTRVKVSPSWHTPSHFCSAAGDESSGSEADEAKPKRVRKRDRMRHLASKMVRVPTPKEPAGTSPLTSKHLPDVTIAGLRDAIEDTQNCPLLRFLQVMDCYDIITTAWEAMDQHPGHMVRKSWYVMPVPRNVPEGVAKLLGIPAALRSCSVWRLQQINSVDELVLVQRCYTRDVKYSDRLEIQSTLSFKAVAEGGVTMRQWVDTIWVTPLPWTHGMVKHFIEKRSKATAESNASDFARVIREAALQHAKA
jgi:hypothetical protein